MRLRKKWGRYPFYFLKIFNQLKILSPGDLCVMENIISIQEIILIYTNAGNETEREAIREKNHQCWPDEGTFTDKVTDIITGRDAITDLIVSSYEQPVFSI